MSEVKVENISMNGDIQPKLEEAGIEAKEPTTHPEPEPRDIQVQPQVMDIPKWKQVEVKVTDYMKKSLDFVAQDQGFKDYELIVDNGSNVGDGFVGMIFKAAIQEKHSDKALHVVIKVPPANLARRLEFNSMALFERECLLYNDILPKLVEFQKNYEIRPDSGFFNFPKCYFAEFNKELEDSIIIMEDLRVHGYQMWSKYIPINFEHAKLVMEHLGRLHAVAFAFKIKHPKEHEEFKKLNDLLTAQMDDPRFQFFLGTLLDQAIGTLDEEDTRRRNKMLVLKENVVKIFQEAFKDNISEPYGILTHGDCWTNNLMFKYRNKRPEKISFIDWQISRYCSPVIDLVYFIFNCTDHEMRKKHYDELIHIYHNSLKKLLDHLGGDTMTQFPLTALLRQLKLFGKFGLLMSTMALPMLTTKNEDLPDMDFLAEEFKGADIETSVDAMKTLFAKKPGEDKYTNRMRGNIYDAISYGFF